ncbi:MAG: tyrosine-type recombinase/integrase [Gemmatimonadota bacterium]
MRCRRSRSPSTRTVHRTKRPLVTPIVAQLRTILLNAKARNRSGYAVDYRGRPVGDIINGVRLAAERAGIRYGRASEDGATFHTLRHSMSTLLATDAQTSAALRQAVMGHADPATTAKYTHLDLQEERTALERHSARLPIADIVMQPGRRAVRRG